MTQAVLEQKLKQAIKEIIEEAVNEYNSGTPSPDAALHSGIEREASKKAKYIYEYLESTVFDKIDDLQTRVKDLEDKLVTLGYTGTTP